jgi:hypothetical protein
MNCTVKSQYELPNKQLSSDRSMEEYEGCKMQSSKTITTDLLTDKFSIALSTNILESLLSSISQAQEQCTIFRSVLCHTTQTLT